MRNKGRNLLVNTIASCGLLPSRLRIIIYNLCGMKIDCKGISSGCFFGGNNIEINSGTSINYGCFFDNSGKISIGKNCNIAMQVLFCTSTHEFGSNERRAGKNVGMNIFVGDGCWIGARSIILPGVRIWEGCIIAAGAIVSKDCLANGLYAGVPATRIKDI